MAKESILSNEQGPKINNRRVTTRVSRESLKMFSKFVNG